MTPQIEEGCQHVLTIGLDILVGCETTLAAGILPYAAAIGALVVNKLRWWTAGLQRVMTAESVFSKTVTRVL